MTGALRTGNTLADNASRLRPCAVGSTLYTYICTCIYLYIYVYIYIYIYVYLVG
jgi:hypothetical protein